jgi:hypothetical protein
MINVSRARFLNHWIKLTDKRRSVPEQMSIPTNNENTAATGVTPDREAVSSPVDIAEAFNQHFTSVFSNHVHETCPQSAPIDGPVLNEISLTPCEVVAALRSLDVSKASGPDGIPARLLKETAEEIAPSLTLFYNKSLQTGVNGNAWKLANVVPIHKKENKDYVENYRPISLLSIISKVLERCVLV